MAILSREDARAILEKVLRLSKAEGCDVQLFGTVGGNLRFARNTVSTSGATNDTTLAVQSNYGKKSGAASVNEFDDATLERAVRRAEELAQLAPENPEFVEVLEPQQYLESKAYFEATANIDPAYRTAAAAGGIEPSVAKDLTAAGYLEDQAFFQAKMNSKGLFAYHSSTRVDYSLTVRSNDGTGSGYARGDHNDVQRFDAGRISRIAIDKAVLSRSPKAIEPGKYTVILEPAASLPILESMFFGMDARQTDEGRSFLSKPGGGSKLGEKLVDERVTISSDPTSLELPATPFSGDGRPQEKLAWIDKGVLKNMFYSRYWAQKQNVKAVPFPSNFIMDGGTMSLEDMIKDTKRGVLVTRVWYIRMVDPQTVLVTGLTRDGTFYIENGAIAYPVKNFRFNESPVIMLNNLEALGRPERVVSVESDNAALIPPMKIRDFTFSSLSDAV